MRSAGAPISGKLNSLEKDMVDFENLHNEALAETLHLLEKGIQQPMEIIREKYSSSEKRMSEGQWDFYERNLPSFILENAKDDDTVKNFLTSYLVLCGTLLETAAKNESIPIEYVTLVLEKQKEELLKIACEQKPTELLMLLMEKDKELANFKMFDGSYALHYAMQRGSEDTIDILLYYGAVIEAEDGNGRNALHYAAMNKSDGIWIRYSNDQRFIKLLKRPDRFGEFPRKD